MFKIISALIVCLIGGAVFSDHEEDLATKKNDDTVQDVLKERAELINEILLVIEAKDDSFISVENKKALERMKNASIESEKVKDD